MIEIKQLKKRFGKLDVLKNIDLDLTGNGRVIAILGPNGSGKTTLIKSIMGMVIPDGGVITINGQNIHNEWLYRDKISYLPQIARFPENLKVREVIQLIKSLRSRQTREELLITLLGLESHLDKKLAYLSGGTRQKVNLTLALMYDNPLIILDEPTAGLDPVALIKFKDWMEKEKQAGKLILLTTHIMPLVEETADEIIFILEGQVYFKGTPGELRYKYPGENLERSIALLLNKAGPDFQTGKIYTTSTSSSV